MCWFPSIWSLMWEPKRGFCSLFSILSQSVALSQDAALMSFLFQNFRYFYNNMSRSGSGTVELKWVSKFQPNGIRLELFRSNFLLHWEYFLRNFIKKKAIRRARLTDFQTILQDYKIFKLGNHAWCGFWFEKKNWTNSVQVLISAIGNRCDAVLTQRHSSWLKLWHQFQFTRSVTFFRLVLL